MISTWVITILVVVLTVVFGRTVIPDSDNSTVMLYGTDEYALLLMDRLAEAGNTPWVFVSASSPDEVTEAVETVEAEAEEAVEEVTTEAEEVFEEAAEDVGEAVEEPEEDDFDSAPDESEDDEPDEDEE